MNIKQLTHIMVLAEELNFHRAADRVCLTQSALSRSIARFEEEVGIRIFDRTNAQVLLTSAGKQVLHRVRRLLDEAHNFAQDLNVLKIGEGGTTSFGVGPFLAATIIPSALKKYHLEYPGVRLNLAINGWSHLMTLLRNEDIEFFIADIRQIADDPNLEITLLGSPSIGFYCRAAHPLLQHGGKTISPEKMLEYPLASVAIPAIVKEEIKRELGIINGHFNIDIQCDDLLLLKNMLFDTSLILLCAKAMMNDKAISGNIVQLNVPMKNTRFGTWGLVKLRHREMAPSSKILADLLVEHIIITTSEF